jgi:hypothetical protein
MVTVDLSISILGITFNIHHIFLSFDKRAPDTSPEVYINTAVSKQQSGCALKIVCGGLGIIGY